MILSVIINNFKVLTTINLIVCKSWSTNSKLKFYIVGGVIAGMLVGLNVIDCNFDLKGVHLDTHSNIIDISLYLRDGNYLKVWNYVFFIALKSPPLMYPTIYQLHPTISCPIQPNRIQPYGSALIVSAACKATHLILQTHSCWY